MSEPAGGVGDAMEVDIESELASLGQLSQEPLYHDQDLLTCGECRREFALADILKFIKHKVKECRNRSGCGENDYNGDNGNGMDELKSLVDCEDKDGQGSDQEEDGSTEVRKQTPSIISQRHKLKSQQAKALQLISTQQRLRNAQLKQRRPQTVDAHTNTINTGN